MLRRVLGETDAEFPDGTGGVNRIQAIEMIMVRMGVDEPIHPGDPQILHQGDDFLLRPLISAVQKPDLILIPEDGAVLIPDGGKPKFQQIRFPVKGKVRVYGGIRDPVDDPGKGKRGSGRFQGSGCFGGIRVKC